MSTLRRCGQRRRKRKSCYASRIVQSVPLPHYYRRSSRLTSTTSLCIPSSQCINNTFNNSSSIRIFLHHPPRSNIFSSTQAPVQTKRLTHHPAAKLSSQAPQTIGHPHIHRGAIHTSHFTCTALHDKVSTYETLSTAAFFVRGALYLASLIRSATLPQNRSSESRGTDSFVGMACMVHEGRPFPRLRASGFEPLVPA